MKLSRLTISHPIEYVKQYHILLSISFIEAAEGAQPKEERKKTQSVAKDTLENQLGEKLQRIRQIKCTFKKRLKLLLLSRFKICPETLKNYHKLWLSVVLGGEQKQSWKDRI